MIDQQIQSHEYKYLERGMDSDQQIQDHEQELNKQEFTDSNVRFVYNMTPNSRSLIEKAAIPNALHFTPFDEQISVERIQNMEGLTCSRCTACINRYATIIEQKRSWICNMCSQANLLNKNLPNTCTESQSYQIELSKNIPQNNEGKSNEQIYLFLVDLCISQKQLEQVKKSIIQFINIKSKAKLLEFTDIRVGLITFSKFIYLYQLNSEINSVISFSGKKLYENQELMDLLAIPRFQSHKDSTILKYKKLCVKYLAKINNENSQNRLIRRISKLKAEGEVSVSTQGKRTRSLRSFGQALNISIAIAENIPYQTRIVTCLGGPCTNGLGKIISPDFSEQSRSITQIDNEPDDLPHFDNARKFYLGLKQKILGRGIILDLFVFSLEEVGITEMYELIRVSGGFLVLGEQFSGANQIFQQSFRKAYIFLEPVQQDFEENYSLCDLSGTSTFFNVICSTDVSINGALGQCHPMKDFFPTSKTTYSKCISQQSQGFGKTNAWYLGSLDLYRSITLIYEINSQKESLSSAYFFQFKTFYTDCYGRKILRVTTVSRPFQNNKDVIAQNFDQEAAALLLARLYIYRQMYDLKGNTQHWIDKALVSWARTFAQYQKGDSSSFRLPDSMKYLPQFIYNFRRTSIYRRSGISLDQLYYQMHTLNRYTVDKCITMIQPALLSYSVENLVPKAVRLDEREMKEAVILLLDTYFNVILWYGESISYWQQEKYHEKEQYSHIKNLLQAPKQDIEYLLNNRFPFPGFYKTCPNHSKQRFLKSKINPKDKIENENLLTDDSSLAKFTSAMIDIVVKAKK